MLTLKDLRVYALDGQHRLGMRGLRELRDHGFLQMRAPWFSAGQPNEPG